MIQEDHVSFETAKLLKEKGFKEICNKCYGTQSKKFFSSIRFNDDDTMYAAPTLQMATKWLREVHKLHIEFVLNQDVQNEEAAIENYYFFNVSRLDRFANEGGDCKSYKSYEDAYQSAIKYCLENLI